MACEAEMEKLEEIGKRISTEDEQNIFINAINGTIEQKKNQIKAMKFEKEVMDKVADKVANYSYDFEIPPKVSYRFTTNTNGMF